MQRYVQLLLLFYIPLLSATAQENIDIQWENGKAKSIIIPTSVLKHYPPYPDSVSFFKVTLDGESTSILGSTVITQPGLKFSPHWPLNPGITYQVYWKDKLIDAVRIPTNTGSPPTVRIYPSADTLPENLLKIYFLFSKPMQEGTSKKYIRLLDEKNDTLQNIFLDLKPELWNADHTMLTVWIDPGRIKRELLLNQELGKPLYSNKKYTLVILPGWKDVEGKSLSKKLAKNFFTREADRTKPDIKTWSLVAPQSKTKSGLVIRFREPMDYALAIRGVDIYYKGKPQTGKMNLLENEHTLIFIPDNNWLSGKYEMVINPQVEDLAGNNLQRLFDNDLQDGVSATENQSEKFTIDFEIH